MASPLHHVPDDYSQYPSDAPDSGLAAAQYDDSSLIQQQYETQPGESNGMNNNEPIETRPIYTLFMSGLAPHINEDSFRQAFSHYPSLYSTSMARSKEGGFKPFGFVHFLSDSDRQQAMSADWSQLGERAKPNVGESKNKIFIGNISRNVTEQQFSQHITNVLVPYTFENLVWRVYENDKNRPGYAFVTFANFKLAEYAIRRLHRTEFDGKTLQVDLAKNTPESAPSTSVFVKNIPISVTDDEVKQFFQTATGGTITSIRVVRPQTPAPEYCFAFIDFADSPSAQRAIELNGSEFHGSSLHCEAARNPKDRRNERFGPPQRGGFNRFGAMRRRSRSRSPFARRPYARRSRSPEPYRYGYAYRRGRSRSPPRGYPFNPMMGMMGPYPPYDPKMGMGAHMGMMPYTMPMAGMPGMPPFDPAAMGVPPVYDRVRSRTPSPRRGDRDFDRRRR